MKMIINGKPADSVSGITREIYSPADGAILDTVPVASEEDLELAFEAAREGQKKWAKVPVYKRAEILMRFLELVERDKEELIQTLSADNGKPITQARQEISNISTAFRAFAEKAKHYYGTIIPPGIEPGHEQNLQLVTKEPVGIVLCIIPFNFPSNLFCQKVAPALMMGNAALVLPPSGNPLTNLKMTQLLVEAGVTDGAIQCVTAPGPLKQKAVADPRTAFVTITGSTETGLKIAETAAKNLTPYALELGGNDPFIVLDDGDLDLAVSEIVAGRMINSGQVCSASKRFLIHDSLVEEFTEKAVRLIADLKVGLPSCEDTQVTCLINEDAAREVEKQVNLTVSQGAEIALGGKRNGAFYQPTVLVNVPSSADIARDLEVFGPVVPILSFHTDEEAVAIANRSVFGLSSCIFTADSKRAHRMAARLEAGSVIINGSTFLRSFEMPFGGWKQSGVGTEGVMSTFEEMTRTKVLAFKNLL